MVHSPYKSPCRRGAEMFAGGSKLAQSQVDAVLLITVMNEPTRGRRVDLRDELKKG